MLDSIFTTFYVSENSGNSAPVIGKNLAIIGESNNAIFHPDEALEVQILNISFSDVKKEIENEISKIIGKIELNKTINNGQVASKKAKKILNLKNKIMSLENLLNYECIEDIDVSVLGKDEVVNFLENKGLSNSKVCGLIKKLFWISKDWKFLKKSSLFSKCLILNTKGGCLPFIAIKAPVYRVFRT